MEMAQLIICILSKHEGMGSIPRTHLKKPDVAASACKHSTEEGDTGWSRQPA